METEKELYIITDDIVEQKVKHGRWLTIQRLINNNWQVDVRITVKDTNFILSEKDAKKLIATIKKHFKKPTI